MSPMVALRRTPSQGGRHRSQHSRARTTSAPSEGPGGGGGGSRKACWPGKKGNDWWPTEPAGGGAWPNKKSGAQAQAAASLPPSLRAKCVALDPGLRLFVFLVQAHPCMPRLEILDWTSACYRGACDARAHHRQPQSSPASRSSRRAKSDASLRLSETRRACAWTSALGAHTSASVIQLGASEFGRCGPKSTKLGARMGTWVANAWTQARDCDQFGDEHKQHP